MSDETNVQRLLKHLDDTTLASKLIHAHQSGNEGLDLAKKLLHARLEEIRGQLDKS